MYLEILLTIWFVIWLIIKIGMFPDYIKNSWDTADIRPALDTTRQTYCSGYLKWRWEKNLRKGKGRRIWGVYERAKKTSKI